MKVSDFLFGFIVGSIVALAITFGSAIIDVKDKYERLNKDIKTVEYRIKNVEITLEEIDG